MICVRVGTGNPEGLNPLTAARVRLPDRRIVTIEATCHAVYGDHAPTLKYIAELLDTWDGHLAYFPMPGQRAYEAAQWLVGQLGGETISSPPPLVPPVDPTVVY